MDNDADCITNYKDVKAERCAYIPPSTFQEDPFIWTVIAEEGS